MKKLVDPLLDRLLGEDIRVELVAGDNQFEFSQIFLCLEFAEKRRCHPLETAQGT